MKSSWSLKWLITCFIGFIVFSYFLHAVFLQIISHSIDSVEIREELITQFSKHLLLSVFLLFVCLGWVGYYFLNKFSSLLDPKLKLALRQLRIPFSEDMSVLEAPILEQKLNALTESIEKNINQETSLNNNLEAVFLSMFDGVMIVDEFGKIILVNKALRELLAINHDPKGFRPIEIIRNIEIQELVDKVLKLSKGVESIELTLLLVEEKFLQVHATAVVDGQNIKGAVLVFHDITELRRLERIRRDFVANVSHELRTPVSTIKGYAETLLDGALDDKTHAKEFVEIIQVDAERLARIVNDLLDLSKIESGKFQFNFTSCNLKSIVERVENILQKQLKDHQIKLDINIPNNFEHVKADEMALSQVFFNLIENAIKYNKPHGQIFVEAQSFGSVVKVNVRDTGIGIPEEDIDRVFERFYRVDKAHSRQMGGSGLGLSIVKHIISAHQGEIRVESILGVGSNFIFTLPKA